MSAVAKGYCHEEARVCRTAVVSYLMARPSRDLIRAARQELTREWWERRRESFGLFPSQLVLEESGAGDTEAAKRRLDVLEGVSLLDMRGEVAELAAGLIEDGPLPAAAAGDSIHLALAAVYDMDFLLTWNSGISRTQSSAGRWRTSFGRAATALPSSARPKN